MIKKFTAILLISAYMIGCKSIVSDDASQSEIAESVLRISSEFTTDKQVYKSGETVILHLENISDQDLGYNLCSAVLEQKKGSSWHAMPSLRLCVAVLYSLEPGKTTTYPFDLDESLLAGEYRFAAEIHLMKSGMNGRRISNIFVVEE